MRALERLGYRVDRQTGSHVRLTAGAAGREHHVTVPAHDVLKPGTLASALREVSAFSGLTRNELLERLFG